MPNVKLDGHYSHQEEQKYAGKIPNSVQRAEPKEGPHNMSAVKLYCHRPCPKEQKYVHEVQGSVQKAQPKDSPHNIFDCYHPCPKEQKHVHEVQGSVQIAELKDGPHNHRFATVLSEAIYITREDHIHEVKFCTDFFEGHFHEFCGKTGGAIKVGDGHVHFLRSVTTEVDGHRHKFRLSSFIEDPIEEERH